MDIKLTDYDMDLTNGLLSWVTGIEAVAQHAKMRLRTWLGETVYDQSAGVPWTQVIFKKTTSLDSVRFILEQIVRGTPGVTAVALVPEFDRTSRTLTISGTITALDQEIDFTDTISEP